MTAFILLIGAIQNPPLSLLHTLLGQLYHEGPTFYFPEKLITLNINIFIVHNPHATGEVGAQLCAAAIIYLRSE